jgi:hypothetical protein
MGLRRDAIGNHGRARGRGPPRQGATDHAAEEEVPFICDWRQVGVGREVNRPGFQVFKSTAGP